MTTELTLGGTRLTVPVVRLFANCPNFEEPLPYKVHSPVSIEVFRIFVVALDAVPPVIATENMNDLFLLCHEFGFTSLLSQVTDFISGHSAVDYEA
jgi:hypothetical protein